MSDSARGGRETRSAVYVLAIDVGTTGAKSCVYRLGSSIELAASAHFEYPIRFLEGGGAEQDPEDWWAAACKGARASLSSVGLEPRNIRGLAFCCQMQGLVLVDRAGIALRPAMSYLDQRAVEQKRRGLERGLKVAGMELRKLLPSLIVAGGVSASVKDPLWKYQWVREREP